MPSSLTTNMKRNIEAKLHTHTRCIVCDADDEYKYTDNNTSEKKKDRKIEVYISIGRDGQTADDRI